MGQHHKGNRHPHTVRFPVEHYEVYVAAAKRARLPVGEYVARKLAELHDLQMPTPAPSRTQPALIDEGDLEMAS